MTVDNFADSATGTAAATTGAISITFQSVRLDYIWTGSVQIPDAPPSPVVPVKFTAFDAGIPIGSWYNDQSSGNLQVLQQLSITATGLAAGSYRAFFKGMISSRKETPPFWPGPTPAPPPGTPQILTKTASPNQSILANSTASVGTAPASGLFPVIVGTSLEIIGFNPAQAMQIRLQWFSAVGGDATPVFTFDVAAGLLLSGLVLPNLGPFVAVTVANGPGNSNFSVTIFTGLPPIVRPPIVAGSIIATYNLGVAAGGNSGFINIPPYAGSVSVEFNAYNNAFAGNPMVCDFVANDYLGVQIPLGSYLPTLVRAANALMAPAVTIYLPPKINQFVISNLDAVQHVARLAVVAAL